MSNKKHRTTDPACMWSITPSTKLGWWWFNRQRGKLCLECADIRRRSPDCRAKAACILVDGPRHALPGTPVSGGSRHADTPTSHTSLT